MGGETMEALRSLILDGHRRWILPAVVLAVVLSGIIWRANRVPHLPYDAADGEYSSYCCGHIELRDGDLYANGARLTGYVVMRDERGPYILPHTFVGTLNTGVEADGSRPPRQLRLDTLPHPNRIEFPDADGPSSFRRKVARVR
jgi:hypothetical protein